MKKNMLEGKDLFHTGLVFGFDVGTGSIGYAVRQGAKFLDMGVLICDSEGSDTTKNKTAKQGVWRLCLRNAFEQVYPHGG